MKELLIDCYIHGRDPYFTKRVKCFTKLINSNSTMSNNVFYQIHGELSRHLFSGKSASKETYLQTKIFPKTFR